MLTVTAIQLAFYVLAYLATPHDIAWQVESSWPRLSRQVALPLTFSLMVMLANTAGPGTASPQGPR